MLFFYDKKREEAKEKNSITYYSPSSFVLWLAAAMFSGTIVVTVEKPQLPSSQFPFFWLECCWPKQYCTEMHFGYFLSGFHISCYDQTVMIKSNIVHEIHYVSRKLSSLYNTTKNMAYDIKLDKKWTKCIVVLYFAAKWSGVGENFHFFFYML